MCDMFALYAFITALMSSSGHSRRISTCHFNLLSTARWVSAGILCIYLFRFFLVEIYALRHRAFLSFINMYTFMQLSHPKCVS